MEKKRELFISVYLDVDGKIIRQYSMGQNSVGQPKAITGDVDITISKILELFDRVGDDGQTNWVEDDDGTVRYY